MEVLNFDIFCSRKVDLESRDKSSILSFSLSDEPLSLKLSHYPDKEKVSLIVIRKCGLFTECFFYCYVYFILFQFLSRCT